MTVARKEHLGCILFLLNVGCTNAFFTLSPSTTSTAFSSKSWMQYSKQPQSQLSKYLHLIVESSLFEKGKSLEMSSGGGGNFYNDFGDMFEDNDNNQDDDDDDEDDEDDEDEYANLDVGSFRAQLDNIMGNENPKDSKEVDELISFATGKSTTPEKPITEWAEPLEFETVKELESILTAGTVLIANPAKFCSDFEIAGDDSNKRKNRNNDVSPALLSKFGLTLPPPVDLGPDRRADLLPVLVIIEKHGLKGCQAVLMNRRTGYLIGDLEQEKPPPASLPSDFADGPKTQPLSSDDDDEEEGESGGGGTQRLWAFMIQPLWFGGTAPGDTGGLDMLHPCPMIPDSKPLTKDGLFWGGDPGAAQGIMERGDVSLILHGEYDEDGEERTRPLSGFDFKFFVQRTRWLPTQLEKEIRDGTWYTASVSKEVLFKGRDRLGTRRAKPLWTEVMELMGGKYKDICDQFYAASK